MNLKIYPYQADRNKGFSASSKSDLLTRSLIENPSKDERCRYHNQRPMIAINSMLYQQPESGHADFNDRTPQKGRILPPPPPPTSVVPSQ